MKATLTGVFETAPMTLNGRAREAARSDAILDDPMAIRLADSIDYDFKKFGATRQDVALRALAYHRCARRYLDTHPKAAVVALAEGLRTSFWRLDAALPEAQFRWLPVDLPPVIARGRRFAGVTADDGVRAIRAGRQLDGPGGYH